MCWQQGKLSAGDGGVITHMGKTFRSVLRGRSSMELCKGILGEGDDWDLGMLCKEGRHLIENSCWHTGDNKSC